MDGRQHLTVKEVIERYAGLMAAFAKRERICQDPACVNRECIKERHEKENVRGTDPYSDC